MVPTIRIAARGASDEDVREVMYVAGGLEGGFRGDRRCCDPVVVVAEPEEGLDPQVFPPPAHQDTVMTVVVETRETSVQIDGGPQEPATDGQGHHVVVGGHRRRKV